MSTSFSSSAARPKSTSVEALHNDSLLNAYEALLQAKAMLRGEESPFPVRSSAATDNASLSPSPFCPTPRPTHTHNTADSVSRGNRDCGTSQLRTLGCNSSSSNNSGSSSSNGATQSRNCSGPSAESNATAASLHHNDNDRGSAVRVKKHASSRRSPPRNARAAATTPIPSPSPEAPLRVTDAGSQRVDQNGKPQQTPHVRFSLSAASENARAARPSASPSPVPPSPAPYACSKRAISAVDARTVELLQCLSYEEVNAVRASLDPHHRTDFFYADQWGLSLSPLRASTAESSPAKHEGLRGGDVEIFAGFGISLCAESPVLLDVDAQLRYSEVFYEQLMRDDDDVGVDNNGADSKKTSSGRLGADKVFDVKKTSTPQPRHANPTNAVDGPTCGDASPQGAVINREVQIDNNDEELTLSPIMRISPSASPARHATSHTRPRYVEVQPTAAAAPLHAHSRAHYRPPPTAGPSILVSPQKPHRAASPSSTSPRPQITIIGPDGKDDARRSLGRSPSPRTSPVEDSLRASVTVFASTSASSTSWSLKDFDVGSRIGSGSTGRTYLAREKQSKVVVALRSVDATVLAERLDVENTTDLVSRSARLQKLCGRHCPHIVKLYTHFADAQRVYLTLEYAAEGDLASFRARQPRQQLAEAQVRHIVHQLALALQHLHSNNIVHGAVAPHHVLLFDKGKGLTAKLGNFLKALRLKPGCDRVALPVESSVDYAAPEVVRHAGHSLKSDMWSLGVLTYELLCGHLPFEHVSVTQAKRLICTGAVYYPPWLSATAKSFMSSLLVVEEDGRSSASEALQHPFLKCMSIVPASAVLSTDRPATTSRGTENVDQASKKVSSSASTRDGSRPPVNRDLSASFSQVDDASHPAAADEDDLGAAAAASPGVSGFSPFGGVSTTSFIPLAGCTITTMESLTLSSSSATTTTTSSGRRCGASSGGGATPAARSTSDQVEEGEGDGSASTSIMSAFPTSAATSVTAASAAGAPITFLNFAVPSHSWRSSTQPYGTSGSGGSIILSGGLPSVMPTSPPTPLYAGAMDEASTRLQRRSSATSMKSALLSSRPSLTATFSDVSASLLSTTCAPGGGAGGLFSLDGHGTGKGHPITGGSGGHQLSNSGGGGGDGGGHSADGESRVPCSVTLSSLSAASPRPEMEWASALDVSASTQASHDAPPSASTSSSRLSSPVGLVRHEASLAAAVAVLKHSAEKTGKEHLPQGTAASSQKTVGQTVGTSKAVAAGVPAAGTQRLMVQRRRPKGPECAMRLDFDDVSDDEW